MIKQKSKTGTYTGTCLELVPGSLVQHWPPGLAPHHGVLLEFYMMQNDVHFRYNKQNKSFMSKCIFHKINYETKVLVQQGSKKLFCLKYIL